MPGQLPGLIFIAKENLAEQHLYQATRVNSELRPLLALSGRLCTRATTRPRLEAESMIECGDRLNVQLSIWPTPWTY